MTEQTQDDNAIDPNRMYFSATTLAFYPGAMRDSYTDWPEDATPVDQDVHVEFSTRTPSGKTRGADSGGNPIWVDIPPPTTQEAAAILAKRIDNALDYLAAQWGYSKGIDNAATWSVSTNPQFAAEGKALAVYRDEVWVWVSAQPPGTISREGMPEVPQRPMATISQGEAA